MKKIFCDIDSTINDHWKRIRKFSIKHLRHADGHKSNWRVWPGDDIDKEAFGEAAMKDLPLPHARNCLRVLMDRDFELTFLTSRGWDLGGYVTERWLALHGFDFHKTVLKVPSHSAKMALLEIHRPDYWIDDLTSGQERLVPTFLGDLANKATGVGINVIVFRNDWLDVLDQIKLIEGWD